MTFSHLFVLTLQKENLFFYGIEILHGNNFSEILRSENTSPYIINIRAIHGCKVYITAYMAEKRSVTYVMA